MQQLKASVIKQYKINKFYFITLAFIIGISILTIYSTTLVSEYNSKISDEEAESARHLVNYTAIFGEYQTLKAREKLYQIEIDNLNTALSDKNQQSSTIDQQQNLAKYQLLEDELHADKDHDDSLMNIKYKTEAALNSYDLSLKKSNKYESLTKKYDFVTTLLVMAATLGGMSEIGKNKILGYSAFGFGGSGVIILLLTMLIQ